MIKYYIGFIFLLLFCCVNERKKTDSEFLKPIDSVPKYSSEILLKNDSLIKNDTLINTNDFLVLANKDAIIKIIKQSDSLKYQDYKVFDFKNDLFFISKNLKEESYKIYQKYNPKYKFEDFRVNLYNGPLKKPNFKSSPWAKRYITRIKEECSKGINFAGKYTLVIWGCGSPCQGGVIVDRTNGEIYDGYFSLFGSKFEINSKLIIINSGLINEKTNLMDLHNIEDVSTEVWNGKKFEKL